MTDLINKAITDRTTISFIYDGRRRVIEPHHIGVLGVHDQIHGYQVYAGLTQPGWRNFIVSKMQDIRLSSFNTFIPQTTYNPDNSKYSKIYISVLQRDYDPDNPGDSGSHRP